jgi:hypothetical protein
MGEARKRKHRLGASYGTPQGSNRPPCLPDPIPFIGADGHTYVTLVRPDGETESRRVADLVAAAFLGPCPAGQHLVHGPGGITDNSLKNLSYQPIEAK